MADISMQPLAEDLTTADGDPITLPGDLLWEDRYQWTPYDQTAERTLDGSVVIHSSERDGGRPITLSADRDRAWIDSTTLAALVALVEADQAVAITLPGDTARVCLWRHWDTPLTADPLFVGADRFVVTLRLLEI
jgi:hypothetical protein